MKRLRLISILLILMMTVCLISGCAKSGSSGDADSQASGTEQQAGDAGSQASGTDAQAADAVEYTGIISAMDNEVKLLLSEAEIDHVDTIGGIDFNVGTLSDQPVVIARSGIGKILSSAGLTAMLNNYEISRVIFTGIAGGVGDETNVLDVVIGTRLVQHDYGTMTNDGFVWTAGNTGENVGEDGYYFSDNDLVDLAYDSAVEVMGEEHVFKGTIATGDQFIASESYVEKLQNDFDAIACEMEGASIAAVCKQYDKPFVVIRAMSDKADGNAHESIDNMGDIAADNSSKIVMRMMKQE